MPLAAARTRRRSRCACRRRAARPRRAPAVAFEVVDAPPLDDDSGCRELGLFDGVDDVRAVREDREPVGPARDEPRTVGEVGRLADEGETAVLQLPRVARRAAEHRHAVERAEARDRRERLAQPRRDEHGAGCHGRRRAGRRPCSAVTKRMPSGPIRSRGPRPRLHRSSTRRSDRPSSSARASLRSSSGGTPSRVRKPCERSVAALRGRPASTSTTVARARPRLSAADSPAGPPPMMTTSACGGPVPRVSHARRPAEGAPR